MEFIGINIPATMAGCHLILYTQWIYHTALIEEPADKNLVNWLFPLSVVVVVVLWWYLIDHLE